MSTTRSSLYTGTFMKDTVTPPRDLLQEPIRAGRRYHRSAYAGLAISLSAIAIMGSKAEVVNLPEYGPRKPLAQEKTADFVKPDLPSIPKRDFRLTDFHPVGDPNSATGADVTQAFLDAVAACTRAGGGRLIIPPGLYRTRPAQLTSSMELHLEKGATLTFTTDPKDYELPNRGNRECLEAANCHDIAITGEGTIDGSGGDWWPRYRKTYVLPPGSPPLLHRPYMVVFRQCKRVLIEGVTLANSPSFHLVPGQCEQVTIRDIRIIAPRDAPNTDGIDPSGWNFWITNCTIDVGDDNIALKPAKKISPDRPSCSSFLIENCTFKHGHGMSIGGQTPGGLNDLLVRNCTFEDTDSGIRMKAARGSGGVSENLRYENLQMTRVKVPIFITSYYPRVPKDVETEAAQAITPLTPIWRHIRIQDVTVTDSPEGGRIIGLPEIPVEDIQLNRVTIRAEKGLTVINARQIRFVESTVTVQKGPKLIATHARVEGLEVSDRP